MAQIHECIEVSVALEHDTSADATVTAIRTAFGDKPFAPKAQTAITTPSRFYPDGNLINKFHDPKMLDTKNPV